MVSKRQRGRCTLGILENTRYSIKITNNKVMNSVRTPSDLRVHLSQKNIQIGNNWATVKLSSMIFRGKTRIGLHNAPQQKKPSVLGGKRESDGFPQEILTSQDGLQTMGFPQDLVPLIFSKISPMRKTHLGAMLSDSNWTFTINQIIEAPKTNKIAMVSKPSSKQRIKLWEISTQRGKHEPYQAMIRST